MSASRLPMMFSFFATLLSVNVCFAQFTTGSSIRAADVNSLRASIDAKRVGCGLAAQAWTDDPLTPGNPIKQIHMTELRAAVDGAYSSQSQPRPTYTDASMPPATPIRAVHFQEISAAVTALSCAPIVNGLCGGANGNSYATAALANSAGLCGVGTAVPAAVSGGAPWSWSCVGSGAGHTDASCSAIGGGSSCPAQILSWTIGGNTCSASFPVLTASSVSPVMTDSGAPTGGKAAFTCDATANWSASPQPGATCLLAAGPGAHWCGTGWSTPRPPPSGGYGWIFCGCGNSPEWWTANPMVPNGC